MQRGKDRQARGAQQPQTRLFFASLNFVSAIADIGTARGFYRGEVA